jgi:hypothetical protein
LLGLLRLLCGTGGDTLPGFDGGRVTRDVADEMLGMERGDEGLVGELGELGGSEFGECAGEGGRVRELIGREPAKERAQGGIRAEGAEEYPGVGIAADLLGDEGGGDREAVLPGVAVSKAAGGYRENGIMAQVAMKSFWCPSISAKTGPRRGNSAPGRRWANCESFEERVSCFCSQPERKSGFSLVD